MIKNEFPPNYDEIIQHFAVGDLKTVIFTYAPHIYNPHNQPMTPDLIAHEQTHIGQQKNPKAWWKRYFKDTEFRLEQELEAYRVQYWTLNRQNRRKYLSQIGEKLSGVMYGNIISKSDAIQLISERRES